ncbi:hypothetical protein V6N13_042787 [Hibiscus sabdariffa]
MQQNRSRSILELMWEDRNQHVQESLRPTDACPYQHTRDSQGRRVDDPYEENASTLISAQLAEVTKLIASLQPPRATQRVHLMTISCDCFGEHHSFRNCPYNTEAYGHIEDYNWNQQQSPSCPQQEPSNSMDVELARLEALVREATYDMNSMLQQSTHWDTEILMQEVKEQWEESSPMCGTQLEPPNQEHVDEKEFSNELQQQIATANIGEPEQSNAKITLSEAQKSNASANSEEPDAENVTTTLMLKQESVNCSYPQLP